MRTKSLTLQTENLPPLLKNIEAPKTLSDARELLGSLISAFIQRRVNCEDSKCLCYLVTSFCAVSTQADVLTKLDELESLVKQRGTR